MKKVSRLVASGMTKYHSCHAATQPRRHLFPKHKMQENRGQKLEGHRVEVTINDSSCIKGHLQCVLINSAAFSIILSQDMHFPGQISAPCRLSEPGIERY